MQKVTYPRACPTCGKKLNRGHFCHHKKRCGTLEHRVQCPFCLLTFAYKRGMQHHVRQQHSNTLRFPCTIYGLVLTGAKGLRVHVETVHSTQKPRYVCWFCNATFTRNDNRQIHMRRFHGRRCREQEVNLHLYLYHLSEGDDFQNEWMFMESRPIKRGEHNICPCGQTGLCYYFFMENKWNGNRTLGSECIGNIDPKAGAVIYHFNHILHHGVKGIYMGEGYKGLQKFTANPTTTLVRCLPIVQHLNPPLKRDT